jgi:hypothetical protein
MTIEFIHGLKLLSVQLSYFYSHNYLITIVYCSWHSGYECITKDVSLLLPHIYDNLISENYLSL